MEHNPHGQKHPGDIALATLKYSKMGNTAYKLEIEAVEALITTLRDDNMRLEGELATRDETIARMLRDQQCAKEGTTVDKLRQQVSIPIGPGPVTDMLGVPVVDSMLNPGYVAGDLPAPPSAGEPDPAWQGEGGTSGGSGASASWDADPIGVDVSNTTHPAESGVSSASCDTSSDSSSSYDSGSSDSGSSCDSGGGGGE